MKLTQPSEMKIYERHGLETQLKIWRAENKKIVFTNGVFDILHKGHVVLLAKSAGYADILIIGLNSDSSVKRLKGENRPVNDQETRALLLASFAVTDAVIIFEENDPLNLINLINPDVLVKGGDYSRDTIIGAPNVIHNGGQVIIIDLEEGFSTTSTIAKIKDIQRS